MRQTKFGLNTEVKYFKKLLLAITITSLVGCGSDDKSVEPTALQNKPPALVMGEDQSVDENTEVVLTAQGTDPEGRELSYEWSQTDGTSVELNTSTTASTSFIAPDVSEQANLEFQLSVKDSAGEVVTGSVIVTVNPVFAQLSNTAISFSSVPVQNQEVAINFISDDDLGEINWQVEMQPETSALTLTKSEDQSVTLTPTAVGEYKLIAQSKDNNSVKSTTFSITPSFEFDVLKVSGNDDTTEVNELIGAISNQSWVYSSSLDKDALKTLVANYEQLVVKGYDETQGLLVEYDESDLKTKEAMELLKLEQGVSSVDNRVFEGQNVLRQEDTIPNDGSDFTDGGDNWHLEKILATAAWDFTTGSTDVLVAISDGGFDTTHPELKGRYSEVLTSQVSDHGTAVAGTIGAATNNGTGMSGINWSSQLILGNWGKESLKALLSKAGVVTVNSSWSIPGYIPVSFDPSNIVSLEERNTLALVASRPYRKIAESNLDKLLVWSAGNGIGNGAGNSNNVYGVDARLHSSALHFTSNGTLQKQQNVMFVAVVDDDNRLPFYSNYGSSVDIAAPTSYKTLKSNSQYYTDGQYGDGTSAFSGTSSGAAIVTGVASLIYSIYPDFTGEEVKNILIDSATEFVTERYITPSKSVDEGTNIATLAHQIPIVNAQKALEKAQAIIDSKVIISSAIPDPFTAQTQLLFDSIDTDLQVENIEWELQSFGASDKWQTVKTSSTAESELLVDLDTSASRHRLLATINLLNPTSGSEVVVVKEYEFEYSTVILTAKDTVSLEPQVGVQISLESDTGQNFEMSSYTDSLGVSKMYLEAGSYKAYGTQEGYQTAAISIIVNDESTIQTTLNLASTEVGAVGSLSGFVVDGNGNPLEGASVRISGGEQTNGFFAASTTDSNGEFAISNISKSDSDGGEIESFIMEVSAFGYTTSVREEVIILAGKERLENFTLVSQNLEEQIIFSDGFEEGENSWQFTGFWNQVDLANNSITNTLVDGGYTSLAPDEEGPKALLPKASSGNSAWWYGQEDTGTFIGKQYSNDYLLSGGQSEQANSGQLVSPAIDLTSVSAALLKFRTWWEIESVNPNENGYDIMEVQISTDSGETFETLKKLNPFVDPNEADRKAKPFSSGGYNRKPVWVLEELDLTDYVGQSVVIRFDFQTNDGLYNGFRGWIIDDFEMLGFASDSKMLQSTKALTPSLTKAAASDKSDVSEKFVEVHKKPQVYSLKVTPTRD
ncbi:peptidase [Pseudoalteromonas sp. FUC4]|uniref:S8 family serine peptidase n=1 Tax=Pseudoalteromonas sp. FUC4 TaxID=2511201 RepID=UPI0011F2051F|nr:S8 family serine peptidase [Pseudoalteromonas sp. FUC4]KAA1151377.1 peptidase [Pseudoalteromonas sp. FUC4]